VARAAGSDDATISAVYCTETLPKAARAGVAVEGVESHSKPWGALGVAVRVIR
jgi:hypothetical protein